MMRVNQYGPDFAIVRNGTPFITGGLGGETLFTLEYAHSGGRERERERERASIGRRRGA